MAVTRRSTTSGFGATQLPSTPRPLPSGSASPRFTSGPVSASPKPLLRTKATTMKTTLVGSMNLPPQPKVFEPFRSISINRRALPSTLAIGDSPRRSSALASPEDAAHQRALMKMRPAEVERLETWMAGVTDTSEMLCDKLERNAKESKDRIRKLNDSISHLTAEMKDFRSAKEDWDDMVNMSSKLVKRKRNATKDAYDRITDANHQIGRELCKNFPYIPYELLVDHQYAVTFPPKC